MTRTVLTILVLVGLAAGGDDEPLRAEREAAAQADGPVGLVGDDQPIPLVKNTGTLYLQVRPSPALIYLDGELIGATARGAVLPVQGAPGLRELVVQRVGYHDHCSDLRLVTNQDRHATVDLVPLRRHAPQNALPRRIRIGQSVRGAIARGDARFVDAMRGLAPKLAPKTKDYTLADVLTVHEAAGTKLVLDVNSSGPELRVLIVDDQHKVMAADDEKEWSKKLRFTTEEGRRYAVVLAWCERGRNQLLDRSRYTVQLLRQ